MFNRLPKKVRYDSKGKRITTIAKSIVGQLYEKAMEVSYPGKGKWPEYRPSSFPGCGILLFRRLIKGCSTGNFEDNNTASGGYFCAVGTAAHENIQFHMGFTGKVFGDWKCTNLQCNCGRDAVTLKDEYGEVIRKGKLTRKNSTINTCPSCGNPMQYVEKEIRYRGLIGHIDCIIRLEDGSYWVADYKTASKYIIHNTTLPKKANVKQIITYCYVLEKKYGLTIDGFSLLYFSRDNPFDYKECANDWTDDWRQQAKDLIFEEKEKYLDGLEAFAFLDIPIVIEHKQCSSKEYYTKHVDYYDACPMLDVCFNRQKLIASLQDFVEEYPTKKQNRMALMREIRAVVK